MKYSMPIILVLKHWHNVYDKGLGDLSKISCKSFLMESVRSINVRILLKVQYVVSS